MRYFPWLDKTIGAKLADGSIGRLVFLRAHFELAADHGLLIPLGDAALILARRWFNSPVRSIYALGGVKHGSLSLQVEFGQGQTALLSCEQTHGAEPTVALLGTGQHGTLRFDDTPAPADLEQPLPPAPRGYRRFIEQSLLSGKIVRAEVE